MVALARMYPIETVRGNSSTNRSDVVAIEEPLEIRLALRSQSGPGRALAVTMRTPGHDEELAIGFLHGEGIVHGADDICEVRRCGTTGNVVRVALRDDLDIETSRLDRNFYTSSSCGLCGKASIEAAMGAVPVARVPDGSRFSASVLVTLPALMRRAQPTFDATGGLHAAAVFSARGDLEVLREDVGRHNALDKVIGACLRAAALPLGDSMIVLSGRASFELLQKAMAAQIPLVAAVGAPSTLAIELADAAGITLVGFLRDGSFNVYTHGQRLQAAHCFGSASPEQSARVEAI